MYRRILIATDLSDAADTALDHAARLAKRDAAQLAVCHVLPDLGPVNMLFPQANERSALAIADIERRVTESLEERIRARGAAAEVFVEMGVDYERVVARADAWGADLVVVASKGRTGIPRALLGSVAERIVRHAGRPVLVARPGDDAGPIVAATDLSAHSVPVLHAAWEESQRSGRALVVVHALELANHPMAHTAGLPFGMTWQNVDAETQKHVRDAAEQTLRSACDLAGATCETLVVDGSPASAVVTEAERRGASLLLVATHGRTGLRRVALGSVAERIVRHAASSVLVVPFADKTDKT
jgi:nucleotide-binding universal stress UspA family protein